MNALDDRFAETRARMDDGERAEFDAYVKSLPEGSPIFWRCTFTNSTFNGVPIRPAHQHIGRVR